MPEMTTCEEPLALSDAHAQIAVWVAEEYTRHHAHTRAAFVAEVTPTLFAARPVDGSAEARAVARGVELALSIIRHAAGLPAVIPETQETSRHDH